MSPLWSLPNKNLILASKSAARRALDQAGIAYDCEPAAIDKATIRDAAQSEGAANDIAVLLAEMKGERIAAKHNDAMIISSDQLLVCDGMLYGKPKTFEQAHQQIAALSPQAPSAYHSCDVI